ncbi:hypothetical protein ENUP19_0047G0224 [Entamoeba nuttalli]
MRGIYILFFIQSLAFSIHEQHIEFPLTGDWSMPSPFPFLTQTTGKIQAFPPRVLNITEEGSIIECHIQITDGKYGQDDILEFTSFLLIKKNQTSSHGYLVSKVITPTPIRIIRRAIVTHNITKFIDSLPSLNVIIPLEDLKRNLENITINGTLNWNDKTMRFTLCPINKKELEDSALPYLGLVLILAVIQAFAFVKQMDCAKTESSLKRSSYNTIVFMATSDAFVCHVHVYLASLFTPSSLAFRFSILLSFLYFMIFSVYDVKYIFTIWKSQYGTVSQRSAMLLYLRLYATLFILFILSVFSLHYFLIVCFSLWMPQIYQNIITNNSQVISLRYIIITTFPRCVLVLYWFAFPYNFMNYRVDGVLVITLFSLVFLQIFIIVIQKRYGARCFIPKFIQKLCINEEYNYHHGWSDIAKIRGTLECVICMAPIENTHMETGCPEIVVTPCGHVFHTDCLASWIDYKMDCPTCRAPLEGVF